MIFQKLTELESLNGKVACFKGVLRSCKSGVQVRVLKNSSAFRDMAFLMIFPVFFFKILG